MNSRIRDLREDADFTQAQIASYLNTVSYTHLTLPTNSLV